MRLQVLYAALFAVPSLSAAPSFVRDIKPLLQKHCQGCHQPAAKASGLDLTSYAGFRQGGLKGTAFVAGQPDESLTVRVLTGASKPRMPFNAEPLGEREIGLFRDWIRDGAKDDSPAEVTSTGPIHYIQAPVLTALRFSPDGATLAVSGSGEVLLHKSDGSALLRRLSGKAERILSLEFSADGKLLVAGGGTPAQFGEVQVWDAETGKLLRSATLTTDTVFGASLSPDASKIAVGCADNTVHVFETATGKELYKIGNHENWVLDTVFGVDSKRFVSVGRDRAAKLIDANSGAFLENLNLLRGELTAVARHPKKDIVIIGSDDRNAQIYLMDRPKNMKIADDTTLLKTIERQDGAITTMEWSPDGSRIAIASASPSVNLYDPESGDRKASCKGHEAGIYALAFSPDGQQLATGGFDGRVRIYRTADCTLLHSFIPVPITGDSNGGTR